MKIIISEDKMSNALERAINKELKNLKDLSESEDFDMESVPDNISWDTMNWIDYVEKIEVVKVHKDINPNPQFTSFNALINVYTNYLTFFDVEPIISDLEDLTTPPRLSSWQAIGYRKPRSATAPKQLRSSLPLARYLTLLATVCTSTRSSKE